MILYGYCSNIQKSCLKFTWLIWYCTIPEGEGVKEREHLYRTLYEQTHLCIFQTYFSNIVFKKTWLSIQYKLFLYFFFIEVMFKNLSVQFYILELSSIPFFLTKSTNMHGA